MSAAHSVPAVQVTEVSRAYVDAVDRRIDQVVREFPEATFAEIVPRVRGAFPSIVYARLLGRTNVRSAERRQSTASVGRKHYDPELHPIDFEWYFSQRGIDSILAALPQNISRMLCIGAPTVAAALSQSRQTVLLDANPLVKERFRNVTGLDITTSNISAWTAPDTFPAVFFDAPWYEQAAMYWFWRAWRAAEPKGIVLFSLFPRLTRPGANDERDRILAFAGEAGVTSVRESCIEYETPLFEARALAEAGVPDPGPWRRGDLVAVRITRSAPMLPPMEPEAEVSWETFVVGAQVIKLREATSGPPGEVLAPLDECPRFVLPSVSSREPLRSRIDFWTSRNRVAQVGQRAAVTAVLSILQQGGSIDDGVKEASPSAGERSTLMRRFRAVLDMSTHAF